MEYKMRGLVPDDIFVMATILTNIGVDEIKKCFYAPLQDMMSGERGDDMIEKVGMNVMAEMAAVIIKGLPKCRDDLYGFIVSVYGIGYTDLRNLKPAEFVRMVKDLLHHEDMPDFFTAVAELLCLGHTDSSTSSTADTQTRQSC